jgi:hypothetical protein
MQFSAHISPFESVLGTLLSEINAVRQQQDNIIADDTTHVYELPDPWRDFKQTLCKFQRDYNSERMELKKMILDYEEKKKIHESLVNMLDVVSSQPDLKESLTKTVREFEEKNSFEDFREAIAYQKAVCRAKGDALENTNAEEQSRFQCFVCMERYIEKFLDPCGHVICDQCWLRASANAGDKCPGCRTPVRRARKIFTMN